MKLSIGMIVKNESKYLAQCLDGLKPILMNVDSELIVVDTGSTDNTVEIAKRYTDKVFFHKWNNDFAEARNVTIEKAQGDWYFYLDADEILEKAESIIDFFNSGVYKDYEAFAIKIINLVKADRSQIGSTFHSRRIVKKDNQLKFSRKIHELLPEKSPIYGSDTLLIHYGYIKTDSSFVEKKSNRNIEIIKEELENDPDSIFLLYYLAQTYNFNQNEFEALKPATRALEIARKSKIYPLQVYVLMMEIYMKNHMFADVEKIAYEVLNADLDENSAYINIYLFLSQAQGLLRKNEEAIESYKRCLELYRLYEKNELPVDLNSVVTDFGGERFIYSQISALYDILFDYENSAKYNRMLMELVEKVDSKIDQDYYYRAVSQIVKLDIKYKKYNNLIIDYEKVLEVEQKSNAFFTDRFVNTLESMTVNNNNHKIHVVDRFAKLEIDTDYVFLNKIRKKEALKQTLSDEDIKKVLTYDFSDKIDIYGEFIYCLMKNGVKINSILCRLEEKEINRYNEYMVRTFSNFSSVVADYFKKYEDIFDIRYVVFSKALKRIVLIKEEIDTESYLGLFKRYIEEGVFYLENVYNENILDTENTYVLKNHEEAFLLFMRKAQMNKDNDQSKYLQYMRKALSAYDYMKKGVELLLEELKNEEKKLEKTDNHTKNEFEEYKILVKSNITALVEDKKIAEAKQLIDEYLKIVPDDLEMLTLKSEIQLQLM